jgi:hypothetical protein
VRSTSGLDGTRDVDDGTTAGDGTMRAAGRLLDAFWPLAAHHTDILHVQDAIERAEADHAKADQVRMARDVTTMFDEMKALADKHAELHSDRARLQAESEQRTRELDRLRDDQAAERARLLDQLAQTRSEAANERAHSRSLSEQFERVHREHRDDADRERRPWWRRLLGW